MLNDKVLIKEQKLKFTQESSEPSSKKSANSAAGGQQVGNLYYIEFEIKVIDRGLGISEDGLKSLFMNFQSLKEHKSMNQNGVGLGISICKQLIQKMGGKVTVQS